MHVMRNVLNEWTHVNAKSHESVREDAGSSCTPLPVLPPPSSQPFNSALPIVPFPTPEQGNSLRRLTELHDNSAGPLLSESIPSPCTPIAVAAANRFPRFLKKRSTAIKRAESAARGIPTPRPIFAAVERPWDGVDSGVGVDVEFEPGPVDRGGCCLSKEPVSLEFALVDLGDEFDETDNEEFVVGVGVEPDIVEASVKSSDLYLIQIAPAGTLFPSKVNVAVFPSTSPSPVYATVLITVSSILDVHNVDTPPGGLTAGEV